MDSSRMRTARSLPYGGSLSGGSPWTETPSPWTETLPRPPWTETPTSPDRNPPGQRPPDRDPSQTETPLDRDPDPPPVDRQTPVKQNPSTANRVDSTWRCSVKSTCRISPSISAQWGTLCRSLR